MRAGLHWFRLTDSDCQTAFHRYTALTANGSVEIEEVRGIVAAQPTESNRGAPEKVVTLWVRGTKQSHTQVFTVRATLSDVPGSTEVVGVTVEDGARSKDDSFIKGPPGFRAWTDGEALEQAGWVSLPRRQKVGHVCFAVYAPPPFSLDPFSCECMYSHFRTDHRLFRRHQLQRNPASPRKTTDDSLVSSSPWHLLTLRSRGCRASFDPMRSFQRASNHTFKISFSTAVYCIQTQVACCV